MRPGKHIVTVMNCGLTEMNGKMNPFMVFRNEAGDEITWYGNLTTEKAKELAMKAACNVGFSGNSWSEFDLDHVNIAKPVEIEVAEEVYQGKARIKVKWVNKARSLKVMSADEVKAKLGSSDEFQLFRAKNQIEVEKSDEVPF